MTGLARARRAALACRVASLAAAATAAEICRRTQRRSGYDFMSRETRAMQDDDTANPGMLWVLDGEALWSQHGGRGRQILRRLPWRCARQHEGRRGALSGVRRRARPRRSISSSASISAAREHQQATPLPFESSELLALTALCRAPVARHADRRRRRSADSRRFIEPGGSSSSARQGQLNLSCAQCHDDNGGKHLAAAPIPQGHPTGYPLYRLEWQSLGSLQRRLRNCMIGMRAEPYAYDAPGVRP